MALRPGRDFLTQLQSPIGFIFLGLLAQFTFGIAVSFAQNGLHTGTASEDVYTNAAAFMSRTNPQADTPHLDCLAGLGCESGQPAAQAAVQSQQSSPSATSPRLIRGWGQSEQSGTAAPLAVANPQSAVAPPPSTAVWENDDGTSAPSGMVDRSAISGSDPSADAADNQLSMDGYAKTQHGTPQHCASNPQVCTMVGGQPVYDQGDGVEPEPAPSCKDKLETAQKTCRTLQGAGDDPATAVVIGAMVSQITNAAAMVATAGKDPKRQCEIQADINKWMGTLSAAKGTACAVTMRSCTSTCDQEAAQNEKTNPGAARLARNASKACSSMIIDVYQMGTQFLASVPGYMANRECAKDFGAETPVAEPEIPDWAKPVGDCNDPRNMSLGCQCLRPEGASKSECLALKGLPGYDHLAGGTGGLASSLGGGTGGGAGGAGGLPPIPGAEGPGLEPGQPNPGQGGQGQQPMMGGVGGGLGGQGGGLQSLGGDGGGYGPLDDPKSVITGQNSANGAAIGGGGGSGGGFAGGLSGGRGGGGRAKDGLDGLLDRFNLKKLLPKAKVVNRGLAGMSVKSVDGITGPMGPSIFEKATNQYRIQMQKQNVLLDP